MYLSGYVVAKGHSAQSRFPPFRIDEVEHVALRFSVFQVGGCNRAGLRCRGWHRRRCRRPDGNGGSGWSGSVA